MSLEKASLNDVQDALNAVASKSGFRCVPVSWEDAQRGTVDGVLSCWGGNISDVRLWAKDGTLLYTLRTDNWNERLGYVSSSDVAVVVGNHVPGGSPPAPITLRSYLKSFQQYAGYVGVTSEQLWDEEADKLLSIRFQAVFLPIKDDETSEFCTEVYNYNTHDDSNPRNTLLLCSAQGTNVQQDGSGAKKLFLHSVDRDEKVHRYWLEAERSKHKVGGAQLETEEEAAAAAARGKATAIHIGTKAMGTRFNVQMLIQLPCKQKGAERRAECEGGAKLCEAYDDDYCCGPPTTASAMCYESCAPMMCCDAVQECDAPTACYEEEEPQQYCCDEDGDGASVCEEENESCPPPPPPPPPMAAPCPPPPPCAPGAMCAPTANKMDCREVAPEKKKAPVVGTANAARVSRGTEEDVWAGVTNTTPVRDPSQHGTITVTLYYTVAGGVPSPADVESCVADLDALYKACPTDKKLVDCGEIAAELTVKDVEDIVTKITKEEGKSGKEGGCCLQQ